MSPSLGNSLDGHQTVRVAGLAAVGFLVWVARGNRALRFVSDVKNRAGVGGAPKLVRTRLDVAEPKFGSPSISIIALSRKWSEQG